MRTPLGVESINEALPDGFSEKLLGPQGRGVIHEGWIQQPQILNHPSVGWSLFEALMSKCEFVFITTTNRGDQIHNSRQMANTFKVGVEVEKSEEDGLFTRQSFCKAIKTNGRRH